MSEMDPIGFLEEFVVDNPDLERLETIVADFNPFVAMDWTRQELRHSAFLHWFLDPNGTHGLGTYPLRSFLKEVLSNCGELPPEAPSVLDADSWDLVNTVGAREWESIDLFLWNDLEKFVVSIENKVDSSEHSDQLARYRGLVENQYPDYNRLFVFLSPAGDQPSDQAYAPLSYGQLADLVEKTASRRVGQISPEVHSFIQHYCEMVRRHIVEDSEVQALCRRIYEKHRQALDLIFEHRPDRALEITQFLTRWVKECPDLILDSHAKANVKFSTEALEGIPKLGEGWAKSGRMVLIDIENYAEKVALRVVLGPGESALRQVLHEHICQYPKFFNRAHHKLYPKWWSFHAQRWVSKRQYQELSITEIQDILDQRLGGLVTDLLPALKKAFDEFKVPPGVEAEGTPSAEEWNEHPDRP